MSLYHASGCLHSAGTFASELGAVRAPLQPACRVWDTLLVAQWPRGVPALKATVVTKAVAPGKTDPAAWAEASCRIVATDGFYPPGYRLEPDYLRRWGPVVEVQLAAAARRLADALNDALASPK